MRWDVATEAKRAEDLDRRLAARAVKRALDPKGLMNPGKVIPAG